MDKAQVFQSSSITGSTQKTSIKNTTSNLCLVMPTLYLNISLYHKISSAVIILPVMHSMKCLIHHKSIKRSFCSNLCRECWWVCKKAGCLLSRVHLLTSHTGIYGGNTLTVGERSAHVEGHEIGVSGETISLLTPCARGWPSLHRSAVRTQPHYLLWDYNQSNYYSLFATEAESESSATVVHELGEVRKVRTLKWHNPKYRY